MPQPYTTTIRARGLPWFLAKVAAVLVALHLIVMTIYWRDVIPEESYDLRWWQVELFDLDTEASFGTWFSALLLFVTSRFLFLQARHVKASDKGSAVPWLVLAAGFCFLSLDEVVGLHEYLNETLQRHLAPDAKWTSYLGPLALVVGIAFVPWLFRLPPRTRWTFVVGGVLYLGGAVVVEDATEVYKHWGKLRTLEYHLWIALEEGLEMLGVIVFLRGLLGHMAGGRDELAVEARVEE